MRRLLTLFCAVTLVLSCAGPKQLTRMSQRELAAGNPRRAFELARDALDKDRSNAAARAAMAAAAAPLADDYKTRVLDLAGVDTVAAARLAHEFGALRVEVASHGVALSPDAAYAEQESRIITGAAGVYYRMGEASLAADRPKEAYARFLAAREFGSGYRDLERRIDETYRRAVVRVAILPFANQTDVPGLSRELGDRIYAAVARQIAAPRFQFTELLGRDDVYSIVTVAQLEALSPEQALAVGQRLGADQVVTGRFFAMRSSSESDSYGQTIYRKTVERDTGGVTRERYAESDLRVIARARRVQARYELEVLDVRDGTIVAHRENPVEAVARTIWTDFRPNGDCNAYCLVPPDLARADPGRARQASERWNSQCGAWPLPDLLERARDGSGREHYDSRYLREFSDHRRPVFLRELPDEDDLARLALDDVWQPVFEMLRDLDPKD